MKKCINVRFLGIILLFIFLFYSPFLLAASDVIHVTFDREKLQFSNLENYTLVAYEQDIHSNRVGTPQLPVHILYLPLLHDQTIKSVKIRNAVREKINGEFVLYPVQPPQVLSDETPDFIPPDSKIYHSDVLYPLQVIEPGNSGFMFGYKIGAIRIFPVQYIPQKKQLIFNSQLELEVVYENSEKSLRLSVEKSVNTSMIIKTIETLTGVHAVELQCSREDKGLISKLPEGEHAYVIITNSQLENNFQPLADWKRKKGYSAVIVTTSWIQSEYSGTDLQEQIRNFIIDASQTWQTEWILLGGDTRIIPDRKAFAMDCEYGDFNDNYIPCDLYYGALDGNWNANGNDVFGEVDDEVDLYPDVFVGRAGVDTPGEADAFVNKLISYEKYDGADNALSMLFMAGVLWGEPFTNSGEMKDYIDEQFVHEGFDPITKLYSFLGNDDMETALAALNSGPNIINHCNHAWYTGITIEDGLIGRDEADNLANGPNYGILYSTGCWPAAIDYDCFAEHFIANRNGGGVAFIGNSRYGWGSPGNPLYGYSDRFDQEFFKMLFRENVYHIGKTLALAKANFIPFSGQENVYRWHQYQVNLIGDPEMSVWTNTPQILAVDFPSELPSSGGHCIISVTSNGFPVDQALVCLMQGESVYHVGRTEPDGQVAFDVGGCSPAEPLTITVTAQNHIPFEETINIYPEGAYVAIASFDTGGEENDFIQPGQENVLSVVLKNYGTETATGVSFKLVNNNSEISLYDSIYTVSELAPGETSELPAFSYFVSANVKNGDIVHLKCEIADDSGAERTSYIALRAATPVMKYLNYAVTNESTGNGNGIIEPGETAQISILFKNIGLDASVEFFIDFSISENWINMDDHESHVNSVLPGDTVCIENYVVLEAEAPVLAFVPVTLAYHLQGIYEFVDTMYITIGDVVFTDSVETVSANWLHNGDPDLWHISTIRKHSGNHSWACSKIGEYEYENNMVDNTLTSNPIILGRNASLSFWAWYECPNYGTTGLYTEVNDGSGWETLDFIGSGGALGGLPTGMDWYEYRYDLSRYPAGTAVQIRFRFQSDNEAVTEGVYVDDIIIQDELHQLQISAPPVIPEPDVAVAEGETNILLSWENSELLEQIESFDQDGYTFQGYNVYQLPTDFPFRENGTLIATFDIVDGVTAVSENIINPVSGLAEELLMFPGTDSGLQYQMSVDKDYLNNLYFIQGKTYYFAVTAYAYNSQPDACPRCCESMFYVLSHTFDENADGILYGDTLIVNHVSGTADGLVMPVVRDPNVFNGHSYRVEFQSSGKGNLTWNLIDLTDQSTVLSEQMLYSETINAPETGGFQLYVDNPEMKDFSSYKVTGSGYYNISSHYAWNWSASARATDTFISEGTGTEVTTELAIDYEFRFTGQYADPNADVVYIENGTGSMATIVGASYYQLADHPMNPNPGSNEPFSVRVPFEVWNVDEGHQVNFVIFDRLQHSDNVPFYAFYPYGRMYCWILNTPYHESPVNWQQNEQEHLTWNVDFWNTDFMNGDVIRLYYDNPFNRNDVFVFTTDANQEDNGDIDIKFQLLQNYPNPFNPETTIPFRLKSMQPVTIKIYNILGERVRTIRSNGNQLQVVWDGKNESGKQVASGIYFYRMKAGNYTEARKMLLLR